MYYKQFIVTMMLGIVFCFGTVVEAAEKPAAAKTEAADQTQPTVSATPAATPKVAVETTQKPAAAKTETADQTKPAVSATPTTTPTVAAPTVSAPQTENVDDAAPEAFIPKKRFTFPSAMDGAKVLHDFIIQNKGDAPLNITKVKTG